MNCVICGKLKSKWEIFRWWHLSSYFGISGDVCPACYRKVSHDAWGNPDHPRAYLEVCERLGIERK